MDIITKDDLKIFLQPYPSECVSIYMPGYRSGRETQEGRLRLKNLLNQAEKELVALGWRVPDAQAILEPAQRLFGYGHFWQHQSEGLAVFLGKDIFHSYRLPLPFEELLVISNYFHFKPLLPYFAHDGHFYILALSQNKVRLLEGTKYSVAEFDAENDLPDLAQALNFDSFTSHLQFHTSSATPGFGKRPAVYHGHDPSDNEKNTLLRWFHKIDEELLKELEGEQSPLVLAGVDYLFPLYEQANSYPNLIQGGLPGNPEQLSNKELHKEAWNLVEPIFKKDLDQAIEVYSRYKVTAQASDNIRQIILATALGKVSHLFVAADKQVFGKVDIEALRVDVIDDSEKGDTDLLNLAALETLEKGGKVYVLPIAEMPDQKECAAVFRY
ncbi:MAG: hypothetical protein BGO78_06840 [Chloroflexi bacterium 44-23]|nr:MAG: hypothetical protein BGO78_06840 [Chloroflexi bacterium 44-23]